MAEYKNLENIGNLLDEEYMRIKNLISKGETHLNNLAEGFVGADRVIRRLPTADVVEVVRCKNCKYLVDLKCENPNYSDMKIHLEHYCSYGEKRC